MVKAAGRDLVRDAGVLVALVAHATVCSLGFGRLKTSRQIEMQHVFYIALQYAYCTCNICISHKYPYCM
jgi:hypothetical protein